MQKCSPNVLAIGAKKAPDSYMADSLKKQDDRARQSLRVAPAIGVAVDRARLKRVGSVSRNTWITEAIVEKLTRDAPELAADLHEDDLA